MDEIFRETEAHIGLLRESLAEEDSLKKIIRLLSELRYLVAHGNGNGNLIKDYGEINYYVSPLPETNRTSGVLAFSISSIPVLLYDGVDNTNGVYIKKLSKILSSICLTYQDQENVYSTLTWDQLISIIANKFGGAHSDPKGRKEYLYKAQRFTVGGMTAVEFLLDYFAKFILKEVLNRDGLEDQNMLFGNCYYYSENGKENISVEIVPRRTPQDNVNILGFINEIPEYLI